MTNKKRNLYCIFFIILLLPFWISGNLLYNIRKANKVHQVTVKIDSDEKIFESIEVFRISPSGFESKLQMDLKYKSYYSQEKEYFKQIKIIIPKDQINNINKITVIIGIKKIEFANSEFLKLWKNKTKVNSIEFFSPDNVCLKRSIFPKLNQVINWYGDFNIFIYGSLFYLIIYILFIIIFFVFIKGYKFAQKNIPEKLESNLYNEKDLLSVSEYYDDNDNLKSNLNFFDKINLFIIFDKINKKFYYKKIFFLVFVFIIFFALFQRFTINNSLPYNGNDTWGYIGPAVLYLDNGSFHATANRNLPYPLFILLILSAFNDFSYVTIIQHLLGVISGIILFILFRKILKYTILSENRFLIDIISFIILSLFLFNESVIFYEHCLRNESIYPLFLVAISFILFCFLFSIKKENNHLFIFGPLYFFINYLIFLYQPRWGLTVIFNLMVYLFLFLIIKKPLSIKILFLLIIPFLLTFIILYLPEKILIKNNDATGNFLAAKLLFSHSKIIDKVFEKDINDNNFTKYDKEILKRIMYYHNIEYNKKQTKHKYLGYMHNNLVYGEANYYLHSKFSDKEYNKFCKYYFFKAVKNYPLLYLKKVLLELSQFYDFKGGMYPSREFKTDSSAYEHDPFFKYYVKYIPLRSYMDAIDRMQVMKYDFKEIKFPFITLLYLILSFTYIPVLIIFLILFVFDLINAYKSKKTNNYILLGFFIFILFMNNFFISLSSALIYCLDLGRYKDDQFLFVLLSQLLAVLYIYIKNPFYKIKGNNE